MAGEQCPFAGSITTKEADLLHVGQPLLSHYVMIVRLTIELEFENSYRLL